MKTLLLSTAIASLGLATAANATVWTIWSPSYTPGETSGIAMGTMGGVTVSYDGEINKSITNPHCGGICFAYPSWTPTGSYFGGIVSTAPAPSDGTIQLEGGALSGLDTITFSAPVKDPVIAIWSLGSPRTQAEFIFSATATLEAGGPSAEYNGSSVVALGDKVTGKEGNGTVAFVGTYKTITFTTPEFENWYGFTVGTADIPETSTWAMMALGFAGLGYATFRKTSGRAAL